MLGFYKEGSKQLNLVEAEHVFNLKQHFRDEQTVQEKEGNDKRVNNLKASEQKELLIGQLGNSRSKKMINYLKNSVVTV